MHRLKRCSSQCPFIYFDWLLEIDELSTMYPICIYDANKIQKYFSFYAVILCKFVNCSQIMKINTFDQRFQGYPWECMKSIRLCFKWKILKIMLIQIHHSFVFVTFKYWAKIYSACNGQLSYSIWLFLCFTMTTTKGGILLENSISNQGNIFCWKIWQI